MTAPASPRSPAAELPDIELRPEMSLADVMTLATRMHQLGAVEGAMDLYRRVLAVAPEHADALQFLGIALHQTGQPDAALRSLDRSIAVFDGNPSAHLNRGNLLLGMNRSDEAELAYGRAVALGWNTVELHNNLGVLHRVHNRPQQAEASYQRALAIDPNFIDTHNNLAGLYMSLDRHDDAMRHGWLAILAQPFNPRARMLVGLSLNGLGRHDEAVKLYADWQEAEPDNPLPRHYLAACSGVNVPDRADDRYVEKTFDEFANSFDAQLAKLTYRAPELVGAVLARQAGAPGKSLDVLDAGCGTGLCGTWLLPYAKTLTGVDLSGQMLAKAQARSQYDQLVKAELTAFLAAQAPAWDLIVSADTLCYFGALEAVLAGAFGALRPGGLLVFTVEASAEDAAASFTLHPHGRYSHRRNYVEQALAAAGFVQCAALAETLRVENIKPVAGWLVTARRAAGAAAVH